VTAAIRRVRWGIIALAACALGGCAGDFGRVHPSLRSDDMHAWLGPAALRTPGAPSKQPQLTEYERVLRDLAFPLIDPPYNRDRWDSVLNEYGLLGRQWPYPDRGAYATRLFETAYRSQTARYNRLMEDIRNDVVRLDPFFSVAHTVADLDNKRAKAMAQITSLSPDERARATQRIRENEAIVFWVRGSLRERAESYQLTLERLVVAAPSPLALEADRQLKLLQQRITGYSV
jgi:hypothetical protein